MWRHLFKIRGKYVSRPVSRVLSGVASATAIHLGRRSLGASSNQPGREAWKRTLWRELPRPHAHPYLVLLRVGFALPPPLPEARCALTAPFHPCRVRPEPSEAVYSLWHFPWGRPRRPLAA